MKKDGYAGTTIAGTGKRLRMIAKSVNLNDPEAVKEYIASKNTSNGYKEALCDVYDRYVKYHRLTWHRPSCQRDDQPPYVPTHKEIEILVNFKSDEYIVRVAETVEETCKLVEAGFEYVTDLDNVKIFRKPK